MNENQQWVIDMNLEEYRRSKGMTYDEIKLLLGLTQYRSARRWCLGETWPRPEAIEMILERTEGVVSLLAMHKKRVAFERSVQKSVRVSVRDPAHDEVFPLTIVAAVA